MHPAAERIGLADLGPRICIMGPSNSGKSTLASAIGAALDLPPIHLDQLYHEPFSDWHPRTPEAFLALHDAVIRGERWVIEGSYTCCLTGRLRRATGLILLDAPTPVSLLRYLRRSWLRRDRIGGLAGGRDPVRWAMIRHILGATRANRTRYAALFGGLDLPKLRLSSPRDLARFYESEGLRWPDLQGLSRLSWVSRP